MAAPTSSLGTPRIVRPSKLVSSTTTSSGARQMRVSVSEFGRFIGRAMANDIIGGCDEGDSAGRGQRHTAAPAHHSYPETHRADLRSAVLTIPARSPQASAGD